MDVALRLTSAADGHAIRNLWPLYQHDVSAFDGARPNAHGIFGGDDVATLAQHGASLDPWWQSPSLFPYLIVADGAPAGFCLVATGPYLPCPEHADFVVHEFFVLHAYRGAGVAEAAVTEAFARHRGRWEVVTYPNHPRGIAFWRRVVGRVASGQFEEREMDHPWGRKVVFRFASATAASGAG